MALSGKILVTGPGIDKSLLRPLQAAGNEVITRPKPLTPAELTHELRDAVAFMHGGEDWVSRAMLEAAPRLRVIAFLGLGFLTYIDVDAASEFGIRVTYTPARKPHSVAEFTVWRLGAATRQIHLVEGTFSSRWSEVDDTPNPIGEHRIGIVGLGSIGTRIAQILRRGFECDVAYYSRTRKLDVERDLDLTFMELHDLAAWCDVLVVMVPGDDSTRHMIDDKVFDAMPQGSILVNTARASVVDPQALDHALASGRLASAVFDGDYHDFRLREMLPRYRNRLLYTPHVASQTRVSMKLMVNQAVESIEKALNGERDPNTVSG